MAALYSDQSLFVLERCVFTKCYCEENVWKLCQRLKETSSDQLNRCYVVFISNKDRATPVWCQRGSEVEHGEEDRFVVWDYHVIFLHEQEAMTYVYDLDTTLDFPCTLETYADKAIKSEEILRPEFRRKFRVIPAEDFLTHFASDRSHMRDEDGDWLAAPPTYACICTTESTNNLEAFISMEEDDTDHKSSTPVTPGTVLTTAAFYDRFLLRNYAAGLATRVSDSNG